MSGVHSRLTGRRRPQPPLSLPVVCSFRRILGRGPRSAMTVSTVAVCCDDLGLMSDARRLCAMAGLEVEVTGSHDARRWWSGAAAVLLDPPAAGQVAAQGLPRRPRVGLLTRADDPADWRIAVAIGAEQLAVLPDGERLLLDGVLHLYDDTGAAPVVACLPASGGAGASTVAAGLALAAARQGAATLLVDADSVGGGLDLVFGLEHTEGVRWPDVGSPGATPADSLPEGLLIAAPKLTLLSWDRRGADPAEAARRWPAVLPAARASAELVVVDLPRSAALEATGAVDVVLVVARADVRSTVAATNVARGLRSQLRDVRMVVRGVGRGGLPARDVAAAAGLPLAAEVAEDRRLAAAADEGQVTRLLRRLPLDTLAAELRSSRRSAA
jgi:secretion/DNA translocation related CpaE-like protein